VRYSRIHFKDKEIQVWPFVKFNFVDITHRLTKFVRDSRVFKGHMHIFVQHTTAVLYIGEVERFLIEDLISNLIKNFTVYYRNHDNINKRIELEPHLTENECKNSDSHFYASIFGRSSLRIPITGSFLRLGTHQRICLVEFDDPQARMQAGKPGYREVYLSVMGFTQTGL
jgi:secondary thiamine-phosphate synthase enzyme